MPAPLEAESSLTDRYETTVPQAVRRALGLRPHDTVRYRICPSGEVVLTRATSPRSGDPVRGPLLETLTPDMAASAPERFRAVDAECVQRLQSLVGGTDADRGAAPLSNGTGTAAGRRPGL